MKDIYENIDMDILPESKKFTPKIINVSIISTIPKKTFQADFVKLSKRNIERKKTNKLLKIYPKM